MAQAQADSTFDLKDRMVQGKNRQRKERLSGQQTATDKFKEQGTKETGQLFSPTTWGIRHQAAGGTQWCLMGAQTSQPSALDWTRVAGARVPKGEQRG